MGGGSEKHGYGPVSSRKDGPAEMVERGMLWHVDGKDVLGWDKVANSRVRTSEDVAEQEAEEEAGVLG